MDNHTAATRSRQPKGVSVGGQFATESKGEAEGRIQAAFGLDTAPLCITEETALNGDGYDSWEDGVELTFEAARGKKIATQHFPGHRPEVEIGALLVDAPHWRDVWAATVAEAARNNADPVFDCKLRGDEPWKVTGKVSEDGERVRIYQHQRWQTVPEDDVLFASRAAKIARSHWRASANDRGTDSRPFGSRTAHAPIPPPRY
jgi:hypothetical protein